MHISQLKRVVSGVVLSILVGFPLLAMAAPAPAKKIPPPDIDSEEFIRVTQKAVGGDLTEIRQRSFLRVLVVPSKTHFLTDRGRYHGISYEIMREFEKTLNVGFPKKQKKYLSVMFIPVHREEVFKRLQDGRADIALASLTDTPERRQLVDFSVPVYDGVNEIVASGPSSAPIKSLDELSDKMIFVRKSSSFHAHLLKVNEEFAARRLKPIRIREADEHLETEDQLEMLNAGLIEYTVVDQPTGEFWAKVFPKIKLHREVTVATGQQIAWAFRKNTPQLQEAANKFLAKHGKGKSTGETILRRYLNNTKWAKSATNTKDRQRFDKTIAYFRKYGEKYGFDPLMLAAQGYQESGLNQNAKSHVGAIGVMQIMPATGKDLRVGNIHVEENNIHGGTKYMSQLASTYFDDPAIDPFNRTLFCFAAYNAGPGRVAGLRKTAEKLGFNPNVWFGNVETVASMKIGRETTQYVANISKYYIAYKLISEKASDGLNSEKQ